MVCHKRNKTGRRASLLTKPHHCELITPTHLEFYCAHIIVFTIIYLISLMSSSHTQRTWKLVLNRVKISTPVLPLLSGESSPRSSDLESD
jgi:hypothetical protein